MEYMFGFIRVIVLDISKVIGIEGYFVIFLNFLVLFV